MYKALIVSIGLTTRYFLIGIFCLLCNGIISCTSEFISNDEKINALKLQTLPAMAYPTDNPQSAIKVSLGKKLFWDPILSGQRDVACASCHLPNYGYSDGLDLSIGVGGRGAGVDRIQSEAEMPPSGRNSPTIINSGYNGLLNSTQSYDPLNGIMFWDGRKRSLETQCIGPLSLFNAMRGNAYPAALANDSVIQRLKKIPEYVGLFRQSFGEGESLTIENLARAVASFERSIVSNNSAYDQYVRGNSDALTKEQQKGLLLFFGKANCSSCHSGPMFSDFNYYNLGVPFNVKIEKDLGKDKAFLFRTPSLRNASITQPYMHSGVYATLEEVLEHYNQGVSRNIDIPDVDKKIHPLFLSEGEKQSIISFIKGLTDDQFDRSKPLTVPSGLNPGGII
jgi:cytochrome c peroxidase